MARVAFMKQALLRAFVGSIAHNAGLGVAIFYLVTVVLLVVWLCCWLLQKPVEGLGMGVAATTATAALFLVLGHFNARASAH